jgi:hypothetical protein
MKETWTKIRKALDRCGVLLLTDPKLPSLTTIVAGRPIKGSWWGHPKGNLIYNLSNELMDQPDILSVKLINKKVTFVDRRHWQALFAIGVAEHDWQLKTLSTPCKILLKMVNSKGELRADDSRLRQTPSEIGKLAAKLEERLLLYSESIHTESGKHIRVLRSWKNTMRARSHTLKKMPYREAITHFEVVQNQLGDDVTFPWQ